MTLEVVTTQQSDEDTSLPHTKAKWWKNKKWAYFLGGLCLGVGLTALIFASSFPSRYEKGSSNNDNDEKYNSVDVPPVYSHNRNNHLVYYSSFNNQSSKDESTTTTEETNVPTVVVNGFTVCRTEDCNRTSYEFLQTLNFSVDPCDDFYDFVCGTWIKAHPIPPHASKWSHFSVLDMKTNLRTREILRSPIQDEDPRSLKQAKDFYSACSNITQLDRVGLKPLVNVLEELGGWPILYDGNWNASRFDWMISTADLKRMFATSAIFDISINQNTHNKSINSVHFNQPTLFLSRPYLVDPESYPEYIGAYKKLIVDIASELRLSMGNDKVNKTYLESKADEIIDLESQIANTTREALSQYYLRDTSATVTLSFLQSVFNNYTTVNATVPVSVQKLLDRLFTSTGVKINKDDLVSMSDVHYIGNIFEVLVSTPEETLANYLHFRAASWLASGTTSAMRNHILEYHRAVLGVTDRTQREYTCATSAEDKFSLSIGYRFIPEVDRNLKKEIGELFESIRIAFKQLVKKTNYIDEETRNYTTSKLDQIKGCIAYPDWLHNKTAIEKHFIGLELGESGYLEKLLNLRRWLTDEKFRVLRDEFDPSCRWVFPGQIGAYYDIRRKAVSLPAGVLQFPFYARDRPASLNYGGIGTIIGHEITHGFTVAGWTQDLQGNFTNISSCLIDQYETYKLPEVGPDAALNGQLTLDENFPDNGGLMESWTAFKNYEQSEKYYQEQRLPGLESINQDQLFFISFANNWCSSSRRQSLQDQILTDHHSPARFRVLGSLVNFPEFASTWNCPVGSKMNPHPDAKDKCSVFQS